MRIFFLSYSYEKGIRADAGGFRKLWELAWALKKRGHDVMVFYPKLPGYAPVRDVPSRPCPVLDCALLRPLTAYLMQILLAGAIWWKDRPDAVYFRSGYNVLPLLLKPLLGARLVLEVNADTLEFLQVEGAGSVRQRVFRAAEGMNVRWSDRIIALTGGLKQMLVGRYGISEDKIQVIPSGTDSEHFRPEAQTVSRRRIGLSPERPVVGFVGLFYRHQGVPTLLEAIAQLRPAVPELTGLIVGDGVMRPSWEALAKRLGIADCVRFTGQVPYGEVPAYLNAMDVVVAPFTADRGETSPFKILDALACGRPVVASDLPSIRLLAKESGAVILVPPDDPGGLVVVLEGLLQDPDKRRVMGVNGREYVAASHCWELAAQQLMSALGTR
jgi:glycosyltransferase involved in cell wall biosynthesis